MRTRYWQGIRIDGEIPLSLWSGVRNGRSGGEIYRAGRDELTWTNENAASPGGREEPVVDKNAIRKIGKRLTNHDGG